MPWSLLDILFALPTYVLVLLRLTGLVLTAPLYASRLIPDRIRAALIMTVAAMIFPLVRSQAPQEMTMSMMVAGSVAELMIGATIGLSLAILLFAAEVGGVIVGQQAGLRLGEVFDPTGDRQASIIGQVYTITLTTMFLLAGGHRAALAAVLDTYQVIPMLTFRIDESLILLPIEMLTAAFIVGIRLAAPATIALFLTGTAMGFLSRTMPQMNILSVGFSVRAFVAIGAAALALASCQGLMLEAIWDALELIRLSFGVDPVHTHLVT
ncbi:MAG: flagellar biosynthetic protein FliR [Phycisphaerae bacterium]